MKIYRGIEADKCIDYISRVSDYKNVEYISTDIDKFEVLLRVTFCDGTMEECPDKEAYLSLPFQCEEVYENGNIYPEVTLGSWTNSNKLNIQDGNYTWLCIEIEDVIEKAMIEKENERDEI